MLRVFDLSSQVVRGDELHSIHALLNWSYGYIASHFYLSDICIPQTIIAKLIADTIGIDELTYRAPALLSGIAALVVFPLLVRHRLGSVGRVALVALVAASPLLVHFSRFARPYSAVVLLVFIAVMTFDRWLEAGSRRLAATYVVTSVLAVYFHLVAAPAALAPMLVGPLLIRDHAPADRRARLGELLIMGIAIALGLSALLGVPAYSTGSVVLKKVGTGFVDWRAFRGMSHLVAGTWNPWLASVFWALAAMGLYIGALRLRRTTLLIAAASILQVSAILIVAPLGIQEPYILARYVGWLSPFALLFVSLAIADLRRLRLPRNLRLVPVIAGPAFAAALYLEGPLPAMYAQPNNFDFAPHAFDVPVPYRERGSGRGQETRLRGLPEFYKELARQPGQFEVAEAPWYYGFGSYGLYQRVHKKPVRVGFVARSNWPFPGATEIPLSDPRLRFERFVDLWTPKALCGKNVRYVIIHKKVRRVRTIELQPLIDFYRRECGTPAFQDGNIVVFEIQCTEDAVPAS